MIYVYTTLCKIASQYEATIWHKELSLVICDDDLKGKDGVEGWEGGVRMGVEGWEGGDICPHIANLLHGIAETNTTL